MNKNEHRICKVDEGSIAKELGIEENDMLLKINGEVVEDIFDYQYLILDEYVEILIRKENEEEWVLEIEKEYGEDIGVSFENGLMDEYKSCHNNCVFCFIDQLPKGMRETLYFKDDDARLSFLQGNYITLTNMSEKDIERIIKYHLEPINISFHTTNPALRCKMLNNRFAGEALKKVDELFVAGIHMNGQIVLCKGLNDQKELTKTLEDIFQYAPLLESVSVVPVGLSKYRDELYPLSPFLKEDAKEVIQEIHAMQQKCMKKFGYHFVHASDEWYILANETIPCEASYDGYLQIENGVGMVRSLMEEVENAVKEEKNAPSFAEHDRVISFVTGTLIYPIIKELVDKIGTLFEIGTVHIYPIKNMFFGERITVSGLLTGRDIVNQLQGEELGECVYLPSNVLRSGEDVFLDDMHFHEVESTLQVQVDIVKSSGRDLVDILLKRSREPGFKRE